MQFNFFFRSKVSRLSWKASRRNILFSERLCCIFSVTAKDSVKFIAPFSQTLTQPGCHPHHHYHLCNSHLISNIFVIIIITMLIIFAKRMFGGRGGGGGVQDSDWRSLHCDLNSQMGQFCFCCCCWWRWWWWWQDWWWWLGWWRWWRGWWGGGRTR